MWACRTLRRRTRSGLRRGRHQPLPHASTPARAAGRPAPAPRAEPSPTLGRPAKVSPGPSASSKPWVGMFHGHKINVPRGNGAPVSFTFDDGPSPRFTPQVLALLAQHETPAVFCLIGQQARAYPKLVRTEVKAGHVLCDHSRDHDLTMNDRGQGYVTREVGDGLAAIEHASPGTPVRFYRQPGGTWSPKVVHAMHQHDLTPLRWNDDPRDWSRPGSAAIVRRVVDQLEPGTVILMHDGGGDRTQTRGSAALAPRRPHPGRLGACPRPRAAPVRQTGRPTPVARPSTTQAAVVQGTRHLGGMPTRGTGGSAPNSRTLRSALTDRWISAAAST